ncbi:MAG: carbohydrate kinase family protein [bacterium]|nr:carbohydrate kinase family protein [bacterium]
MNEFDLLSVGDATVDVFMNPTETETLCEIDDKKCRICFAYGDKIPVRNLEFTIGGNAANNSTGSSRLGLKNAIVLTLGGDTIGKLIVERLQKERVDTSYVIQQTATSSNYSTVINYGGERTIFTYHAPRSYEFPVQLPVVPWVYLTSMGESYRPFYNHFVDWIRKNTQVKLAFNPGSWQIRAGVEGIKDVLNLTNLIFVNRQEAEKFSGITNSTGKEKELLTSIGKLGPDIVVVTDATNGSFVYDKKRFLKCGILPVDAYERTGAGDAFGTGFLSAVIKGKSLEEALIWGTANSASVIGYVGAQKGLLKENEMIDWIERAKSSGVKVEEL